MTGIWLCICPCAWRRNRCRVWLATLAGLCSCPSAWHALAEERETEGNDKICKTQARMFVVDVLQDLNHVLVRHELALVDRLHEGDDGGVEARVHCRCSRASMQIKP